VSTEPALSVILLALSWTWVISLMQGRGINHTRICQLAKHRHCDSLMLIKAPVFRQYVRLPRHDDRPHKAVSDHQVRLHRVLHGRQLDHQVLGGGEALEENRRRNFGLPGIRRKGVSQLGRTVLKRSQNCH